MVIWNIFLFYNMANMEYILNINQYKSSEFWENVIIIGLIGLGNFLGIEYVKVSAQDCDKSSILFQSKTAVIYLHSVLHLSFYILLSCVYQRKTIYKLQNWSDWFYFWWGLQCSSKSLISFENLTLGSIMTINIGNFGTPYVFHLGLQCNLWKEEDTKVWPLPCR